MEREKEASGKLQTIQTQQLADRSHLHIQIEQLKEANYQADKAIAKLEDKHRRETKEAQEQLQQQTHLHQQLAAQLQGELAEATHKLTNAEVELGRLDCALRVKREECEQLGKHLQEATRQLANNNELSDRLTLNEQELAKAYQLVDQSEAIRDKLEAELTQLRKASEDHQHCPQLVQELETRCRELEEEQRSKDHFNLARTKNPNSAHPHPLSRRLLAKIKDIYQSIRLNTEDSLDSYPRRKDDEGEANLPQAERYINEIGS